MIKIRNERDSIIIDHTIFYCIIREYYNSMPTYFINLDEMDKFLETDTRRNIKSEQMYIDESN